VTESAEQTVEALAGQGSLPVAAEAVDAALALGEDGARRRRDELVPIIRRANELYYQSDSPS